MVLYSVTPKELMLTKKFDVHDSLKTQLIKIVLKRVSQTDNIE
jgi:hypothetical protein